MDRIVGRVPAPLSPSKRVSPLVSGLALRTFGRALKFRQTWCFEKAEMHAKTAVTLWPLLTVLLLDLASKSAVHAWLGKTSTSLGSWVEIRLVSNRRRIFLWGDRQQMRG